MGVQVALVHVCSMTGEEACKWGGCAPPLLSERPDTRVPCVEVLFACLQGGSSLWFHHQAAVRILSALHGAYPVGHIGHASQKDLGQIHLENTESHKANHLCSCRPFQSLYTSVDLQERYDIRSIPQISFIPKALLSVS